MADDHEPIARGRRRPLPRRLVRWLPLAAAAVLLAAALLLAGCCCGPRVEVPGFRDFEPPEPPPLPPPVPPSDVPTRLEIHGTHLRLVDGVVLEVRDLYGEMLANQEGQPVVFGDRESYRVRILSAEAAMSVRSLTAVMNGFIFDYPGAPLRDLVLRIEDGHLVQEGILHKVVDIPFTISAELTATEDGDLRIRPVTMQICGIPGKGLMQALGIEMEDLLDLSRAVGIRVEGDDLILDPETMLPPPAIEGKVSAVRTEGDRVVLVFGTPPEESPLVADWPEPSVPAAENYQFLYGGVVRFGQLFMVGTDMQIIDADPSDPFDFYIDLYESHLVAGYSRSQPDGGLAVYLPDYDEVGEEAEPAEKLPAPEVAAPGG
jgi:hypothetical protein